MSSFYVPFKGHLTQPDYLLKISDHISQFNKSKLLVVGDFNLPGIDWDRIKLGAGSVRDANVLFDMMLGHNLVQVVREPTRHGTGLGSLLDLVFLDRSFSNYHVSVEPGLSDHDIVAVYFSLNVKHTPDTHPPVIVKDFARADDISITEYLESCFCEFRASDVLELWTKFKVMCLFCIDQFIPNKRVKPTKHTPWMNRRTIQLKRKAKRLRKKGAAAVNLTNVRMALSESITEAKKFYFSNTLIL